MAQSFSLEYDEELKKRIHQSFIKTVDPDNFCLFMGGFTPKVLNNMEIEEIKARTRNKGNMQGASLLLEKLIKYPTWFECVIHVLTDDEINLSHIADQFKILKEQHDAAFGTPNVQLCASPPIKTNEVQILNTSGEMKSDFKLIPQNPSELNLPRSDSSTSSSSLNESIPQLDGLSGDSRDGANTQVSFRLDTDTEDDSAKGYLPILNDPNGYGQEKNQESNISQALLVAQCSEMSQVNQVANDTFFQQKDATPQTPNKSINSILTPMSETTKTHPEHRENPTECYENTRISEPVSEDGEFERIQGPSIDEPGAVGGYENLYEDIVNPNFDDIYDDVDPNGLKYPPAQKAPPIPIRFTSMHKNIDEDHKKLQNLVEEDLKTLQLYPEKQDKKRETKNVRTDKRFDFTLEETKQALNDLPGWSGQLSDEEVVLHFSTFLGQEGSYNLFFWAKKKRAAINIVQNGKLKTYTIHKKFDRKDTSDTILFYYLYIQQYKSKCLKSLVKHHIKNGFTDEKAKSSSEKEEEEEKYVRLTNPV